MPQRSQPQSQISEDCPWENASLFAPSRSLQSGFGCRLSGAVQTGILGPWAMTIKRFSIIDNQSSNLGGFGRGMLWIRQAFLLRFFACYRSSTQLHVLCNVLISVALFNQVRKVLIGTAPKVTVIDVFIVTSGSIDAWRGSPSPTDGRAPSCEVLSLGYNHWKGYSLFWRVSVQKVRSSGFSMDGERNPMSTRAQQAVTAVWLTCQRIL